MIKSLKPSAFDANLTIPPSKSYMQRAVAIAALAGGKSTIYNPDKSNDSRAGLGVAQALGCIVEEYSDRVEIIPSVNPMADTVNVGEAGLGLRLYTPICSMLRSDVTITGGGTLLKRPVDEMLEPLRQLGVTATLTNHCAPVHTTGILQGGEVTIDASKSSQFLSGLLIALPKTGKNSHIKISAINSRPYVEMTIEIVKHFGGKITNNDFKDIYIEPIAHYNGCEYTVESDWSSAAAHLAAGAIGGKAIVKGLNPNSLQADKAIIDVLRNCGAGVEVDGNAIIISKKDLRAFQFDATDAPDLFPVLAALAANCKGISEIIGTDRLIHKESNRAQSIAEEFAKIGINVDINNKNKMLIHGGKIHGGVTVSAHHDHRMAMALAVCALTADAPITLEDAESVAKSYPDFWKDWEAGGRQL